MNWHKIGIATTGVFAAVFTTTACKFSDDNSGRIKPNILLINIDDMGWSDVGFMGSEYYETPNLDALAADGMIFTNAYASASNCAPSRSSMLTGQWTQRHGVYTVDSSERGRSRDRKLIPTKNTLFLPEDQYVFSMALQDAGYVTCHAGKWHVSEDPTDYGFDVNIGGHLGYTAIPPLRSGKGSYYEGGIRVPMFAWWNGHIPENTISDVPVTMLDFFPTFLEIAGIEKPAGKRLDGQSLLPLLTNSGTVEKRPLFWHFPVYLQTYLGERDPTQDPLFRTRPGSAVRFGDWKLIQYFEYNDLELYNLKEDISEKNNLAETEPEKRDELLQILESWRKETNAPVPTELNPEYSGN